MILQVQEFIQMQISTYGMRNHAVVLLLLFLFTHTFDGVCQSSSDNQTDALYLNEGFLNEYYQENIPADLIDLLSLTASNPDSVIKGAKKIIESYAYSENSKVLSYLYFMIGRSFDNLDQPIEAIYNYNQAINFLSGSGFALILGDYTAYVGTVFFNFGLFDRARQEYKKSKSYYLQAKATAKVQIIDSNLALIEKETGNYETAQIQYESLLKQREQSDKAFTYILLVELNLLSEQYPDSILVWLEKADGLLVENQSFEYGRFKGYVQEYRGDYYTQKEPVKARMYYEECLQWYQQHDYKLWLRSSQKLARLDASMGKSAQAIERMQALTASLSKEISFSNWYDVHLFYAELLEENQRLVEAYNVMKQLAAKREVYEKKRSKLLLTVLGFSNQLESSQLTVAVQKSQIKFDRWLGILIILLVTVLSVVVYAYVNRQKVIVSKNLELESQRNKLLEQEVIQSRWNYLRLQLKPHFLYNILSSLQSQIHFDPDRAILLIEHIAGYFKHIISAETKDFVPFKRELNLCEEYLSIQKMRYEGKLFFDVEVSEGLEVQKIPSMILFPLVENAVKYGYKTRNGKPLYIKIGAKPWQHQGLCIEVSNTGSWVQPISKTNNKEDALYDGGLGWENIKSRLASYFGNHWELTYEQRSDEVFVRLCFAHLS